MVHMRMGHLGIWNAPLSLPLLFFVNQHDGNRLAVGVSSSVCLRQRLAVFGNNVLTR
jgi:hypothetical protein